MIGLNEIIGLTAGLCTTLSYVPQLILTWRTRSTAGISLGMYVLSCVGLTIWLVYGYTIKALAVMVANSVSLTFAFSILCMKIIFERMPATKKETQHKNKSSL